MNGTISVVIPTMNRRMLLQEALDSLARQTRPCLEAVVIDAGDDASDALCARYPFVRYFRQTTRGLTAARNEALQQVRGEYVGMLDSDDFYEPAFLEECAGALDRAPQALVAYSRGYSIDPDGKRLGTMLQGHRPPARILAALAEDNFVIASFCLLRRSALERVGGYDESLGMADDYDLILRVALLDDRFVHVPLPLASRRKHDGSLTLSHPERNLEIVRKILQALEPQLLQALGTRRPTWLAGVDYRLGRMSFEAGDRERARAFFASALVRRPGHLAAALYYLWVRFHPWVDPILQPARRVKRKLKDALARKGWSEQRWS